MNNSTRGQVTYTVDIVFCIDSTESMAALIGVVKENALKFYDDLITELNRKNKHVNSVRIKVISFRDYLADGEDAMLVTDFFQLPEQIEEFSNTVRGIDHFGGGDIPEDGLEALAYAIRSDWSKAGGKKRQVIVVWSDAPTHPLGFGIESRYYPKGMARNFAELTEWWTNPQGGYVTKQAKRLVLYTPDGEGWSDVIRNWDNVVHFPSQAGQGLMEVDYSEILDAIVRSI